MLHLLDKRQNMVSLPFRFLPTLILFLSWAIVHTGDVTRVFANPSVSVAGSSGPDSRPPLDITAQQVEYDRVAEAFRAIGSVVITQGPLRLTANEATIQNLSGTLIAKGKVHLKDQTTDVWAEELELNVYTESGVITNGKIFLEETKTWIRGRLLQRFSETHLRAKDGTFTNCDADDGQVPDWSFEFADVDIEQGDSLFAKNVWFQVRNQRVIPLPVLRYPMPGARKAGFLVPTAGFDSVLGYQYRQDFFWPISQSQNLLITPQILSVRGFGGDLAYKYIFSRQTQGKWLINSLYDNERTGTLLDSSPNFRKARAQITGSHVQQVNADLNLQININYATDRFLLQDLSSSGIFRALPSQTSTLYLTQRFQRGSAYLGVQYIQPLQIGVPQNNFQRMPEIGYAYTSPAFANDILVGRMESQFVHFWREKGFHISRLALMPEIYAQKLHLGHIVGLRPQIKFREVIYSHGPREKKPGWPHESAPYDEEARERGSFWVGFEAVTNLTRRFSLGQGHRLRHTIESKVFYEYVPYTEQMHSGESQLPRMDGLDNFQKKNLLTYSFNTVLKDERSGRKATSLLDLAIAQSWHLGAELPGSASVFSDIWGRARVGMPTGQFPLLTDGWVAFDTFYDPSDGQFSQFNTDMYLEAKQTAYLQIGHRHTPAGTVPRRGDIWNPLSFNEVLIFSPEAAIDFLTLAGAIRTPFGLTIGSRIYHDYAKDQTPEWDVVGIYQNPCQCWSLSLYWIRLGAEGGVTEEDALPAREQFNFVLTLRGLGSTQGNGTGLLHAILGPLLRNVPGMPWSEN